MKLTLLSLTLFFQTFAAFSQENVKRSYIGASLFFPTPVGHFKSTDVKNDDSGFAKGSLGFGLEGAFMFHPNVGIGGIWAGYASKFNSDAMKSEFEKYGKQELGLYGKWDVKGEPHSIGILMVGPHASLPYKRITLDAKVFIGNFAYKMSDVTITYKDANQSMSVGYQGEYSSTLGFNPGVAARIKLAKRIAFKLSVDYVYGNPEVKLKLTTKTNGIVTSTKYESYKAQVEFVNIGFGLAFQLNKEE